MMGRHSDNARERIIDSAEQVVIEFGAKHLTFDALAAKSGVSRGGLLYHFPDKEALLKAMLDRLVERAKGCREEERARVPSGVDREIVAHVQSALQRDERSMKVGGAAFFALAAHDPGLLAPIREEYRKLMEELTRDGCRYERAAVIVLATDGLRMVELLSVSPFTEEQRDGIVVELLALAKENAGGKP